MRRFFIFFFFIFAFAIMVSSCQSRGLIIRPLHPYSWSKTDTIERGIFENKIKYFFVSNFDYNDSSHINQLKFFAYQQLDANYRTYTNYEVHFYKRTNKLNETFADDEHDELAWHSNDELAEFTWVRGKPLDYLLYKNGDCMNCGDIYITTPAE